MARKQEQITWQTGLANRHEIKFFLILVTNNVLLYMALGSFMKGVKC